jgi:hypothetical protein
MVRFAPLAAVASLSLAAAPVARAAELKDPKDIPPEPGVYWEQQVELQMEGMPFAIPPQKSKVCLPTKGTDEQPPASGDKKQKCKVTDMKKSGTRMTWKMKCEDGSDGEGDITWEKDSYKGTMVMRTQGREMNMKMAGKKVGGDCDAAEVKRQVATMKKQVDDAKQDAAKQQAEQCEDAAASAKLPLFVSPMAMIPVQCKDPAKLCANLDTKKGLVLLKSNGQYPDAREKAEKLCKKGFDPFIERTCTAAENDHAKGKAWDADTFPFVAAYCPALVKSLSKKECSGRSFTSMPPEQRDFCVSLTAGKLASGEDSGGKAKATKKARKPAADEEAAEQPQEDLKSKMMKKFLPF